MAVRARLAAPRDVQYDWQWHTLKAASLPASLLFKRERRMEAENFLASGYATRAAITSRETGWAPLSSVGRTWQPLRLKGIQVAAKHGSPFLAATQVFDVRPVPRKWLSLNRTSDYKERFVSEGTILITCSGTVGRATLATSSLENTLVSHDILRVDSLDSRLWGWLYAYFKAPTVRQMMASAQYGHMIKHLEVQHIDALPFVIMDDDAVVEKCHNMASAIIQKRNEATLKTHEAEAAFQELVGKASSKEQVDEIGFTRSARDTLFGGRRRFDANCYNPKRIEIEEHLAAASSDMQTLDEIGCLVWLPNRFKRVPAENGLDLVTSSAIFEISPDAGRKIVAEGVGDRNGGQVKPGWLLMSRSGQVYGLLGSVAMATAAHEGKIVTDDIIRISPEGHIDSGFLQLALSHHALGRPRVKAIAYGSSIPHIEVEDLKALKIPRFNPDVEAYLGKLVEEAYVAWSSADILERELADIADNFVRQFITS